MKVLEHLTPLQRVPPQSLDAERSVLASILIDNDNMAKALEHITPDDFYKAGHGKIYRTMIDLYERAEPIDLITLTNYLAKADILDTLGGALYLSDLVSDIPTSANIVYHCKIIKEKSILRNLIGAARDITTICFEDHYYIDETLDKAEKMIFAISEHRVKASFVPVKDVLKDTIALVQNLFQRKEGISGLPTGFTDLDMLTTGFYPGDLIILGARPSMGKTALCLNIAQNVAIQTGETVAMFSLEMSKEQLVMRMLCSEAEVDANRIRSGHHSRDEFMKLTNAATRLSEAKIFIDDSNNTVLEIRAKARRLKSEHGLGLIIIDYLQLMGGTHGRGSESREREIAEISRSLKSLAKELNVPIIALSQLNRGVEARVDKHPNLSDLRESGAIEQDADVILFLYRDEYYNTNNESNKGLVELNVAKQRNGPTNTIKLTFIHQYTTFRNYSPRNDLI
jgi:replicative DNA helicase